MKRTHTFIGILFFIFSASICLAQPLVKRGSSAIESGRQAISSATEGISRGTTKALEISSQVEREMARARTKAPYVNTSPQGTLNPNQITGVDTQPAIPSIPPPSTPAKSSLSTNTDLATPDVPLPKSVELLQDNIAAHYQDAIDNPSLTKMQRLRVELAGRYFERLTPEQARDIKTFLSPLARQHAAVLRTPQATEYGYYILGGGTEQNFEHLAEYNGFLGEKGYIPTMLGDPVTGFSRQDIHNMIDMAAKTNKPIFVLMEMHGGISSEKFLAYASEQTVLSTIDIVEDMQRLRTITGTPELNLYLTSCHGGKFLDEFEALPISQRQGINVFVAVGTQQCNYTPNIVNVRSHTPSEDIVSELLQDMIRQIARGNIFVQANIGGQSFNPLELAMKQSAFVPEENRILVSNLDFMRELQQAGTQVSSSDVSLLSKMFVDESIRYYIMRCVDNEVRARWGHPAIKEGSLFLLEETLKTDFSADYKGYEDNKDPSFDWDKTFGFSPLPVIAY